MSRSTKAQKLIDELHEEYHNIALGKEQLLKVLAESEVPEQVYNSNAIENSTLTLEETEKILLEIDLNRYISERELFEAKNLARVVSYIDVRAKDKALDEEMILLLHKMLLSNIRDEIAGRFRTADEWVRVGAHIAPDPKDVPALMQRMLATYNASVGEHIVKRLARLHLTFEHVHPFVDGNGRIGRVINNYILHREGHVPMNIKFIDRDLYYDAFREFDMTGATDIMEGIVARALAMSYHKRLAYMKSLEIVPLQEYAHRTNASHPNLINKAKRQTIPAFLVKGKWMIGVEKET